MEVHKYRSFVPVTCCAMTDASLTGQNYCDHPPVVYPRLPLRVRLRGAWVEWRYRVGCWIAGDELRYRVEEL